MSHGMPKWGSELPEDVSWLRVQIVYIIYIIILYYSILCAFFASQFYERMELFAENSIKKHSELTEKIKREV